MTDATFQLPLPGMEDLSPLDSELLNAIRANVGQDGAARSLFHIAVDQCGIDYPWAHNRLRRLELLGFVRVVRSGGGRPLTIRPTR